jgi:hypothetical protein
MYIEVLKKKTNRKDNVSSQVLVTWKIYCKSPYWIVC